MGNIYIYIYTHNFGIFLDMNPRFGVEHGDKPLFLGSCMLLLSIPKWTILAKEVEV